jgi:4-diphosphocytidyl-2-C-methyl-D-erythritol kinase
LTPDLVKTFAKVNLSLVVHPPDKSGMHPIHSIFQNIDLYDELHITKNSTFKLTCTNKEVPTDENNLITKIYNHFKSKLNTAFSIHLKKNIPMGGGLGGGSSNAAGFLHFLNHSENWNLSIKELTDISRLFGSDIAFFLYGGTALVTGKGEIVTPIQQKITSPLILIMPNLHCNTKSIYNDFDKVSDSSQVSKDVLDHISQNHIGPNFLKKAVFSSNSFFKDLDLFCTSKKLPLHLSGSGACCFIPSTSKTNAMFIQNTINTEYPKLKTQICELSQNGIVLA